MISQDIFLQIRRQFHTEHQNIRQIARHLELDTKTVAKWSRQSEYIPRKTPLRQSKLDSFKPTILKLLNEQGLTAKRICALLQAGGYRGSYSILKTFVRQQRVCVPISPKEFHAHGWMHRIMQDNIPAAELQGDLDGKLGPDGVITLTDHVRAGDLRIRNKAVAMLAFSKPVSLRLISRFLLLDTRTISEWRDKFRKGGIAAVLPSRPPILKKTDLPQYREAVFSILHAPPSAHNINRTSWRMQDIVQVLREKGFGLSKDGVLQIIRKSGFRFRNAKKVLTSNDPDYRQKLLEITNILRNLKSDEKFFSVDEYGPFAVKMQGGRSRMAPGGFRSVPQYQKSKGSLILTAALELSENQVTHFYSERKNTDEMLKLLEMLLAKYADQTCIYFSWDAASWHVSKKLYRRVEEINSPQYQATHKSPLVKLAPLPSCAQFLNVIESVFSGMAKAIIHNSDYQSVDACKAAIDRHFNERNQHFKMNPKRAGDKIWGKERVPPVFDESNNCKAPH
jgi:transposase